MLTSVKGNRAEFQFALVQLKLGGVGVWQCWITVMLD